MAIRRFTGTLVALAASFGGSALALPGTQAPAVSTYDTRASSVVLAYRHGSSDAGPFDTFSYNANFTSTTGKLSAQFGLHYVNYAPSDGDSHAHGVGASGVALFVFPIAGRYDDGVPKAALSFDVGAVPTAYISGQRNFMTLPVVLGFGVPLSPARQVTLTPWFELAPSVNLDTVFHTADIQVDPNAVMYNPATGTASLSQGAVESAVRSGVSADFNFSVPLRAGLEAALHVSQSVDLNLYSSISTLGGGFSGSSVFGLGAGLVLRWDDVVPAVLPVEHRLDQEGCDAIEGRFRSCPNSRRWLTPEQRSRLSSAHAPSPRTTPEAPLPSPTTVPTQQPTPPAENTTAPAPAITPPQAASSAPAPTAGPPSAAFPATN